MGKTKHSCYLCGVECDCGETSTLHCLGCSSCGEVVEDDDWGV